MNFEAELLQLIMQNSSEVDSLRLRAINGNESTLKSFSNVIIKLLRNEDTHSQAYGQINKLLISANPNVANHLNSNVLPVVASSHCRKDLDEYLLLWKKIMPGSNQRLAYPNVKKTFNNVKISRTSQGLSKQLTDCESLFNKNAEQLQSQKVEFFQDFEESSFAEALNEEDKQQIVFMDMDELKQIEKILLQGPVKEAVLEEYLKKAKNFVHLKPQQSIKHMPEYQRQLAWAKTFISNYRTHLIIDQEMVIENEEDHQPKVKAVLPSIISKSIVHQNPSVHFLKIGNQVQEVHYEQEKVRKIESKRFSLAGEDEKAGRFTRKPQKAQQIYLNDESSKRLNHFSLPVPQFILDTDQMKKLNLENSNVRSNSSKVRPKIFSGSNSRLSHHNQMDEPKEELLKVVKHNKKTENIKENTETMVKGRNDLPNYQIPPMTPINNKNRFFNTVSPNTAFLSKTASNQTGYKKLSDFKQEKMQRKMALHNEELTQVQSYLYTPYFQHFNDVNTFSRFRRNCLSSNLLLYANSLLTISCSIERLEDSKIKLQIVFQNKSHVNLSLETLYRIPKCVRIEKYSQISKKWTLRDQNIHSFGMELLQFPLEPCLINFKYALESDYENLKYQKPIIISIPVTIRNFINSLVLNSSEWIEKWTTWSQRGNFRRVRNILLDGLVTHEDDLASVLSDFTTLAPIERYSIKQFGSYCSQSNFDGLTFLLRISQRVENIITLELLASRKEPTTNEAQYLEYCLGVWSMLLAKI